MKTYQCECGKVMGEVCSWTGPASDMVIVEYMPEYLRSSHEAAGNKGIHPHNGSARFAASKGCAEFLVEPEDEWASIVEGEKVEEYAVETDEE
jgi:hypothetical protein